MIIICQPRGVRDTVAQSLILDERVVRGWYEIDLCLIIRNLWGCWWQVANNDTLEVLLNQVFVNKNHVFVNKNHVFVNKDQGFANKNTLGVDLQYFLVTKPGVFRQ